MNNQEAISKVYQYFITEGHPAGILEGSTSCTYSGPCAVGIFLSEDQREIADEAQYSPSHLIDLYPQELGGVGRNLLDALQTQHDNAALCAPEHETFNLGFARRLREIAQAYKLELPGG